MTLLNGFGSNITGKLDWFSIRFYSSCAIGLGTGVTTLVLMGYWRFQGKAWSWQPGHVMLLAVGWDELVTTLAVAVDVFTIDPTYGYDSSRQRIYEIEGLVQHIGVVLFLVLCLYLIRFSRRWQIVLALVVSLNLLVLAALNPFQLPLGRVISIASFQYAISTARIVVIGAVFSLAVWEAVRRECRDWLHWIGAFVLLLHYTKWMSLLPGL